MRGFCLQLVVVGAGGHTAYRHSLTTTGRSCAEGAVWKELCGLLVFLSCFWMIECVRRRYVLYKGSSMSVLILFTYFTVHAPVLLFVFEFWVTSVRDS